MGISPSYRSKSDVQPYAEHIKSNAGPAFLGVAVMSQHPKIWRWDKSAAFGIRYELSDMMSSHRIVNLAISSGDGFFAVNIVIAKISVSAACQWIPKRLEKNLK